MEMHIDENRAGNRVGSTGKMAAHNLAISTQVTTIARVFIALTELAHGSIVYLWRRIIKTTDETDQLAADETTVPIAPISGTSSIFNIIFRINPIMI